MRKIKLIFTFLVFIVLTSSACSNNKYTEQQKTTFLNNLVKCGFGGWNTEISRIDSIEFVFSKTSGQECILRFELNNSDFVNHGARAELSKDFKDEAGTEVTYSWDFLVPQQFIDSRLKNAENGMVNWQLLGQWFATPNFSKGEDWSDYANTSAVIGIYYNFFAEDDTEFQKALNSNESKSVIGFKKALVRKSTISLAYGIPPKTIAIMEVEKGKWVNLKVNVKWSQDANGFVNVFLNDKSMTKGKFFGANMLNSLPHYMKVGYYRNPKIPHTNSVFYRNFQRTVKVTTP